MTSWGFEGGSSPFNFSKFPEFLINIKGETLYERNKTMLPIIRRAFEEKLKH